MIRWIVRAGENGPLAPIVLRAGGDPRALEEGRVFVGRKRVRAADWQVEPGDEISIAEARPVPNVTLLAHEEDLVAADKPAGMPTIADQSGAAHTLVAAVAAAIGASAAALHATSRLDRDVSGVVVFALTPDAARRLEAARDAGSYRRRYVGIAAGAPSPDEGVWDAPIGRASDPRKRAPFGRDPAAATTLYATIARVSQAALLALSPVTGRTHQLRVHASHAGAPLFGDRDYGGPMRVTSAEGRVVALRRVALHAARVIVPRKSGEALQVEAPIPRELAELWEALGGDAGAFEAAIARIVPDR